MFLSHALACFPLRIFYISIGIDFAFLSYFGAPNASWFVGLQSLFRPFPQAVSLISFPAYSSLPYFAASLCACCTDLFSCVFQFKSQHSFRVHTLLIVHLTTNTVFSLIEKIVSNYGKEYTNNELSERSSWQKEQSVIIYNFCPSINNGKNNTNTIFNQWHPNWICPLSP